MDYFMRVGLGLGRTSHSDVSFCTAVMLRLSLSLASGAHYAMLLCDTCSCRPWHCTHESRTLIEVFTVVRVQATPEGEVGRKGISCERTFAAISTPAELEAKASTCHVEGFCE